MFDKILDVDVYSTKPECPPPPRFVFNFAGHLTEVILSLCVEVCFINMLSFD